MNSNATGGIRPCDPITRFGLRGIKNRPSQGTRHPAVADFLCHCFVRKEKREEDGLYT